MTLLRSCLALLLLGALRPTPNANRLDWHTDLAEAQAESELSGRPILSLRMLGRLDDELSCANSRFFRSILYADPAVAKVMRERFVLHWSSERSVPVITIDFGDGRTITRTVTGNSAHYVLDHNARVIDVIPGLYDPDAFIQKLFASLKLPNARVHTALARSIKHDWATRLADAGVQLRPLARGKADAAQALPIAVAKGRVEIPMVVPAVRLAGVSDDAAWLRMLGVEPRARLSAETLAIMRSQNPRLDQTTFESMVTQLRRSLDRDTLQNEYLLHQRIHEYLAKHERPDFTEMNEWVYRELFATPASDPWLGLHDDTIYTGLQDAGVDARRD